MEKLNMESKNLTEDNLEKIAKLFPNVITEMKDENGKIKRGIDFERLKQELTGDVLEGEESYEFTWVGKKQAMLEANTPIRKTLRPSLEESKNWETTQNLYIEGDNLEVLKLLQESYLNQVKMIYIDPPYNTGNDFIYRDNFTIDKDDYEDQLGLFDEEENRLFQNNETNGRFHSDWCSMMYPRLKLAKNLLKDDGVIFISIDDNEVDNLKKICNEVYGEENFLATFVWKRRASSALAKNFVSTDHEYLISYQKSNEFLGFYGIEKDYSGYSNPDNDPNGDWTLGDLTVGMTKEQRPNQFYELVDPLTGNIFSANPNRVWAFIKESMEKEIQAGRVVFPKDVSKRPMVKRYKKNLKSDVNPVSTWINGINEKTEDNSFISGLNSEGTKILQDLFNIPVFNYSKPISLIQSIIKYSSKEDDLIMDFFSGSSSTVHSLFQQSSVDGFSRKFIMVQLPEKTEENSEAFKAGYHTIGDIGKERIRRAGEKIKAVIQKENQQLELGTEPKPIPDIGFRVLKVDDSNMKDVFYAANQYSQEMLAGLESNIKEDRTDLDLLYGVMLDWGLPLSLKHTMEDMHGVTVHTVDEGALMACFAEQVSEDVVREIAKRQPLRVVFRDGSFKNSADKINVEEIFKLLAPNTTVKVL